MSLCRNTQPELVDVEPSLSNTDVPTEQQQQQPENDVKLTINQAYTLTQLLPAEQQQQQQPENDVKLTINRAYTLTQLFTGNRCLPTPPVSYIDSQLYYKIAT